jgi:MFS family permease
MTIHDPECSVPAPPVGDGLNTESSHSVASCPQPVVVLAAAITTTIVALAVTRHNLDARFGPIDDHEPLGWMGSDRRFGAGEVLPTLFRQTEIGDFGQTPRFRPAYYVFRLFQTVLFDDRVRWWYASVLCIYVASAVLLGLALSVTARFIAEISGRRMSTGVQSLLACGAAATVLGLPAWQGIVARLGPSEQLGMLAVSLAAYGTSLAVSGNSARWWVVAGAAAGIAAMSKESFVPLSLVFAGAASVSWWIARDRWRLLAFLMPVAAAVIVAAAVVAELLSSGGDVYGRPVGQRRVSGAWAALSGAPGRPPLLAVCALILSMCLLARCSPRTWHLCRTALAGVAGAGLTLTVADIWINSGEYWLPRYSAILDLTTWAASALAICIAFGCAVTTDSSEQNRPDRLVALGIGLIGVALIVVWTAGGISDVSVASRNNAIATQEFDEGLSAVVHELQDRPNSVFVASVAFGFDYEPAHALVGEVVRQTGREAYLVLDGDPGQPGLLASLDALSRSGNEAIGLLPLGLLSPEADVVCGWINYEPDGSSKCSSRGVVVIAVGM